MTSVNKHSLAIRLKNFHIWSIEFLNNKKRSHALGVPDEPVGGQVVNRRLSNPNQITGFHLVLRPAWNLVDQHVDVFLKLATDDQSLTRTIIFVDTPVVDTVGIGAE